MQKNCELVQEGFRILQPALSTYLVQVFHAEYGDNWRQEVLNTLTDQKNFLFSGSCLEQKSSLDMDSCLCLLDRKWKDLFREKMSRDSRTWARKLTDVRDKVADTSSEDLDKTDTWKALDTMAWLCRTLGAENEKEKILALCRIAVYGPEAAESEEKKTEQKNYELEQEGFAILEPVLAGCIGQVYSLEYGDNWWQEIRNTLSDIAENGDDGWYKVLNSITDPGDLRDLPASGSYSERIDSLNIGQCLQLLNVNRNDMFRKKLGTGYAWQFDLIGFYRRFVQLGLEGVDQEFTVEALDYMARLCAPMDKENGKLIRELYRTARFGKEEWENCEIILKGFQILQPVLAGHVCRVFHTEYGDRWWDKVRETLSNRRDLPQSGSYSELADSLDIASSLFLLDRIWNEQCCDKLNLESSIWVNELLDDWNDINFGSKPLELDQEYTRKALECMARLCDAIDAERGKKIWALFCMV